jgi:hypothetical protein
MDARLIRQNRRTVPITLSPNVKPRERGDGRGLIDNSICDHAKLGRDVQGISRKNREEISRLFVREDYRTSSPSKPASEKRSKTQRTAKGGDEAIV